MREQKQERPGSLGLLISSVLIVCAQVGLAAANNLSFPLLSDAIDSQGPTSGQPQELLVRFAPVDGAPASRPDLVGPLTARSLREGVAEHCVPGATVERQYDKVVPGLASVRVPKGVSLATAMGKFVGCADILYAEPNYRYQLFKQPNDPRFAEQWALENTGQTGGREDADIDAPEAWDITTGSKDIRVAVLDTGVDTEHADLVINLWQNQDEMFGDPDVDDDGNGYADDFYGYDFVNDTAEPVDDMYHGTYVSGIIGAFANNFMGVSGVCWNVSLIACKVADAEGVDLDAAVAAVEYATASGAKIINASWGGPEYSKSLEDAIKAAGEQGVLFVAAAGNNGSNNDDVPVYPASYAMDNVIAVMATNSNDRPALSTNYGPKSVDLAEPGEDVLSTLPTEATDAMTEAGLEPEYGTLSGTSVAAPHVSGAAALLWSQYPSLSIYHVKHALLQTVDKVTPGLCLSHGRLNVAGALEAIPQGEPGRVLNTRDDPADPGSFYTSIQAAIDDANDGDTIIVEGGADGQTVYDERIDFKGKAITLRSGNVANPSDPNIYPETTLIVGLAEEGPVVTFASGEEADSILQGFTIGWGVADYGAGIRIEDASPTITHCVISNNQSRLDGAGIDVYGGTPELTNCVIRDNRAFGAASRGAGISLYDQADATITNCIIRDNVAMNMGGGVYANASAPTFFNCFVTNNSGVLGSGQMHLVDASPTITNCTIVIDEFNPARDGGIWAFDESDPTITNCILWGNGDDLYNCSATYSCIEDREDRGEGVIHTDPQFTRGPRGYYYLSQTEAGQLIGSDCVDAGDPETDGILAGLLSTLTTRTDGVTDGGTVDLGAHYGAAPAVYHPVNVVIMGADGQPADPNQANGHVDPNGGSFREFEVVHLTAHPDEGYRIKQWVSTDGQTIEGGETTLTVTGPVTLVIEFEKIPLYNLVTRVRGGNGELTPLHDRGASYEDGTVVTLTADPIAGYCVKAWDGTDDDDSWKNENTVTIDGDKEVTVEFMATRTLEVPGQYRTIAQAIDAARDHGDKVVVGAGRYQTHSLNFEGKAITLASKFPDDPCCVAETIIDADIDGDGFGDGRAFIFENGEGPDSVIDGFTIVNGSAVPDPNTATDTGGTGATGLDAFGGAVACFGGSSPTLSNLIVRDCVAQGQAGEDASFTFAPHPAPPAPPAPPDPPDPEDAAEVDPNDPNAPADPNAGMDGAAGADGQAGADGANGNPGEDGYAGGRGGEGYGGAFYFDEGSAPTILHCTLINCRAIGGDGGFGGEGQDGQAGQAGQDGQTGQDGQPGGEGQDDGPAGAGGAGGVGGDGGAGGAGGPGGRGGDGGDGGNALGGAMYFGPNCQPTIRFCAIVNSSIHQGIGNYGGAAGSGGPGGPGGLGGLGGVGGEGEPAGEDGAVGVDGIGGNGGNGGDGGHMGRNGDRSWGGAIYFGEGCDVDMADTVVNGSTALAGALAQITTTAYAGGTGGDGGGGGDPAGAGGDAGPGGDGQPVGAPGTPGPAGQDGVEGEPNLPGLPDDSITTNHGGAIAYDIGCTVRLSNCSINGNLVELGNGGGEYYADDCVTELIRCTLGDNVTGANGGGQSFNPGCAITVAGTNYLRNAAALDGGGVFCWYECQLDVNNVLFSENEAQGAFGAGGALYGGGIWDDNAKAYYNGGSIRLQGSQFLSNQATFGGGLYWYGRDAEVDVIDSVIRGNTAQHGGGLYWSSGAPRIVKCSIKENRAMGPESIDSVPAPFPDPNDPNTWPAPTTWPDPNDPNSMFDPNNNWTPPPITSVANLDCGIGGGLVCWSSDALIENTTIGGNSSQGSGGGVYFGGDPFTPELKNCLVKDNTALIGGGGIASHWFAAPTIVNCTVVDNTAADPNEANRGYGGGLHCSYESETTLLNSILWDNQAELGAQAAIGSDSDPIYTQRPATLNVRYSNVEGGPSAIHVEQGRTLNWLEGNLNEDPLFTASYFLSQEAAGQTQTSPAVDAGSATAMQLGLDAYTTRTDNVADAGVVDMGFHYPGEGRYTLTVDVIGGNGRVEPLGGNYHEFSTVTLVATPDPGYRVRQWIGTDNDPAWNENTNTVTLNAGDRFVTVEFERNVTRNILVPAEFPTLDAAVAAASPGDTNIILSQGVHVISSPQGIDMSSKNIRIMSTNPSDPNVVANTIIDCAGSPFAPRRAFWFHGGETRDSIITGLTIRNGYWVGTVGITGGIPGGPVNPDPEVDDSPIIMASGADATGAGYGGAILCENGSSPTIMNCVIENCTVVGAQGGDGVDGFPVSGDTDGFWGGHGGDGDGTGYGGAVAALGGSEPRFVNCTIRNCQARGGMGGAGGNGSERLDGGGNESWGGDGGNALGDGRGGAVYCENGSDAVFEKCVFTNNEALTGEPGGGGRRGGGAGLGDPYPNPADNGFPGSMLSDGMVVGGAVYQNNASPVFVDCEFTENKAYEAHSYSLFTGLYVEDLETEEIRIQQRGGALFAGAGTTVAADRCTFTGNSSGAVYVEGGAVVDYNACTFSRNEADDENAGFAFFSPFLDFDPNDPNGFIDPFANRPSFEYAGGAMYIGPACPDVRLRDCQFYSNTATASGGALRLLSDATITECAFSGNRTGESGGAIHAVHESGDPENPFVLDLTLEGCSFGGNLATEGVFGRGGALHFRDFEASVTDCYFMGNEAKNGGGLFLTNGTLHLSGGAISDNTAIGGSGVDTRVDTDTTDDPFGDIFGTGAISDIYFRRGAQGGVLNPEASIDIGGGVVFAAANAVVEHCTFANNTCEGIRGTGGAIAFYGGYVDHAIRNCLFYGNSATRDGGAVFAGLFATPTIATSTFAGNEAERLGGAVFADWDSDVAVTDSIFQNNSNHAVAEQDFANSTVQYSLFHDNPDGDFGIHDSVEQQTQTLSGADLDVTNIVADPLFIEGPLGSYYLSQVAAGQSETSPAVDAGSTFAVDAGLAERTTRTNGEADSGVVDLGFHYPDHTTMQKYTLTTQVVGGRGIVSPTTGEFYPGTVVPVDATPESGWRIAQWSGTTDDASKARANFVVMGPDRLVTVEFEQPRTIFVGSDPNYTTIQHAIDAAEEGDVVVIPSGTYQPAAWNVYPRNYIRLHGKNITLTGTNPDDPNVVASTFLHLYRFEIQDVGPETVIEGLTIGDVNWVGANGDNGADIGLDPDGQHDGFPGSSLAGGAMTIYNGSPTIRNCIFRDCSITGGDGGDGSNGHDGHSVGYDGGYAGYAYGGAVYCGYRSSPTFENCTFTNCRAIGGNGGNGGTGANGAQGGRGGNLMFSEAIEQTIRLWWDGWEWGPFDAEGNPRETFGTSLGQSTRGYFDDYWKYSGYGGAVYCEYYSSPRFIDCNFTDNQTFGGFSGLGGNNFPIPQENPVKIENFGGAVYVGRGSNPEFMGCVFRGNSADSTPGANPDDIYVSYGGSVAFEEECSPVFIECTIADSNAAIGGGMWWSQSSPTIVDCNIAGNTAFHGGGLYSVESNGQIRDTIVQRNLAFLASVDPNLVADPNAGFAGVLSAGGGYACINSPISVYDSVFTNNRAQSSGGGLYLAGSDNDMTVAPYLHNCLVTGNGAGRDGGGISTWLSEPILSNCTIANNVVAGQAGKAFGGGLYIGYGSNATMRDSIVWRNTSTYTGSEIAVTHGYEYGPNPSTLHVTTSNIQSGEVNDVPAALDLVFVVDTTESMTEAVDALQLAAPEVLDTVALERPDYRIAVVDFKDFNDLADAAAGDYPYRLVTPFTDDLNRVISGLNALQTPAGAGGGNPESIYYPLIQTIDGNDIGDWRTGNVDRVIVLITDSPPHDPEPGTGYTSSTVLSQALRTPGKRIFVLQVGNDPAASIYLGNLAGGAGGTAVRAADPLEVGPALEEILGQTTARGLPIYVSEGSRLPGWDAVESVWDPNMGNIVTDPLFIAGYYLSQTEAGQTEQSPAVDAGSGPAAAPDVALADRTTRTDGVDDVGIVDMGYHYDIGVTLYTLTAEVVVEANDGEPHGTVTPTFALAYEGASDNVVRVEARPETGWKVKSWSGTDDDTSTDSVNFVTLTEDRHVTVTFEKREAQVVTVPGDYPTLQAAVAAAEEGGTIIVDPGTYSSGYQGFALIVDKSLTITSRNPDDPANVASTVLRGPSGIDGNTWNNLGVLFTADAQGTVFNGFTLENFGGFANDGDAGSRDTGHPNGGDGFPIQGAAMILLPGASPVVKNCIIRNNEIYAGNGGDGVAADATFNAGRGGWGGWARGGAIYCAANTNPQFINCIIEDNLARGGDGGNGGAYAEGGGLANYGGNYTPPVGIDIDPDSVGAEPVDEELWKIWQWDHAMLMQAVLTGATVDTANVPVGGGPYVGDYRWYSAYGGAVFVDEGSTAEFIHCTIRNNSTSGGMSGQGGAGPEGRNVEPLIPYEIPSYGGGVYCAADTMVTFDGCSFENNVASGTPAGVDPNFRIDPYLGYGGGVAAEHTAMVLFVDCNVVDNEADTGGGLYLANGDAAVVDCNVATNIALRGAGLAGKGGTLEVAGTVFLNNFATAELDPQNVEILPVGGGMFLETIDAWVHDNDLRGNASDGSGGGMYLRGEGEMYIFNNLIRNNLAFRDGAGISSVWFATPEIRNCTFFSNAAPGLVTDAVSGVGGGIYCGYQSVCTVVDTILWANQARHGTQLAVGSGFELDPLCGTLNVSHSNIMAGPNDVDVDEGCTLSYGEGIINEDPLFVTGPLGRFYLENPAAGPGQSRRSPCIDAGSDLAGNVGMTRYTTRTDRRPDTGIVDIGFHYPFLEPCRFCDLVFDGTIRFEDYAKFAMNWLADGCSEAEGWCEGADFTFDFEVNAVDLAIFADCWLVQDTNPPIPNPAEWDEGGEPVMDGGTVSMRAAEAIDGWGWQVEYYFDCVHGECNDSGWQLDPRYVDRGLGNGMQYGYRVKARDELGNETKWSPIVHAGERDNDPPAPEPFIETIDPNSTTSVIMTASTAFDRNGVQYYFDADDVNTPGANDSGWIDTPTYTDVNLVGDTAYSYRVKARDLSASRNETGWSDWVTVRTLVPPETDPPTPDPMQFDPNGLPVELWGQGGTFDYWADMMAVTAIDASGGVQYFFQADSPHSGFSSGWIDEPTYRVFIGRSNQGIRFRVKARDIHGNETRWSPWHVTQPGGGTVSDDDDDDDGGGNGTAGG